MGGRSPEPPPPAVRAPIAEATGRAPPDPPTPSLSAIPTPPFRHSCAGRNHATSSAHHPTKHHPFPNSSLPPSRGEVRWGVGVPSYRHRPCARQPTPNTKIAYQISLPATRALSDTPTPSPPSPRSSPRHSLRPPPSFLRRQEAGVRLQAQQLVVEHFGGGLVVEALAGGVVGGGERVEVGVAAQAAAQPARRSW